MSLVLECPHCHDCHSVEDWNKRVQESIAVGRAEELIPTNNDLDWNEYSHDKSGVVDCPSCEEVCNYEDITSV